MYQQKMQCLSTHTKIASVRTEVDRNLAYGFNFTC